MGISRTLGARPIIDLEAFYRQRISAVRFIKSIERAARSGFSDDDMVCAAAALPKSDPTLKRTLELATQSIRTRDGLARRAVLGWIRYLIRTEVGAHMPLSEEDHGTARRHFEAIITCFRDLGTSNAPVGHDISPSSNGRSGKLKKRTAPRLVALAQLAFLWLSEERDLSPSDALIGFDMILSHTRKVNLSAKQFVVLAMVRAEQASLLAALAALKYAEQYTASNNRLLLEAQAQAASSEAVVEQMTIRLQEARHEFEVLQGKLAAAHLDIVRLKRDNETRVEGHRHTFGELRGRSLGFVRAKLKPLIDEALDALEGDPPFADIALHRLQSIRTRIFEEETWLARLD